ncbi:MAG TPA: hypothetical protein VF508_13545 [Pyrinomonadaceae bacterium]|jgi:hypothetical protein
MPIPRSENELLPWLNNFYTAFAARADVLGFGDQEVEQLRYDAAMYSYLVGTLAPAYKTAAATVTAYKALILDGPVGETGGPVPTLPDLGMQPAVVPPGILPRLRRLVRRIQAAPAYTDAIGAALGITGEGGASAPSAPPKPTATATALPGSAVRVEFAKGGFDGVQVECRRAGETGWQPLGVDNYSPYTDGRPPLEAGKPEVREYRLRYVSRDEPVGDWSDIAVVSTTP